MLNIHIKTTTAIGIIIVLYVIFADFAILHKGAAISATTAGRIPLKILLTVGFDLISTKKEAIKRMITKEGREHQRAAIILPFVPLNL